MSSIEGIDRGATRDKVYDSSRLKEAPMTRLFEDAHSVAAWREKGFHPVLNEYPASPETNRQASVMYRMLQIKQDNPLPAVDVLPDSFTLSLDRKEVCTSAEEFDDYASKHPLWGMPYALPGLDDREQAILTRWIEEGAVHTARKPLAPEFSAQIARWEKFLNGTSLKHQLSSRYIFEHLSYAHLYFPDVKQLRFFKLVRSSSPPGQAIKIDATRSPFNATASSPVYSVCRKSSAVLSIRHICPMPWIISACSAGRACLSMRITRCPGCLPTTKVKPQTHSLRLPIYQFHPVTSLCWMKPSSLSWHTKKDRLPCRDSTRCYQ